ncbi:MAG: hypothetical protein KDD69_11500, partial [Bdellovibrionales bacterium]|nr:hypothetical protein [Bdellovibrionales bacterium]
MKGYVWLALVSLIVLFSLLLQATLIEKLPVAMDEFDGAYDVYRLASELPYRDFKPYKTVLGYYVQLPALFAAISSWNGIMLVRLQMAVLNAVLLFAATLWLGKRFGKAPSVLALLLWISMSSWITRSAEVRVDTMTAWAGLLSLLLLLDRRYLLAGLAAGVSFLISQKAVYYFAATGLSLAALWLLTNERRRVGSAIVHFTGAGVALIAVYLGAWSLVATPDATNQATFLSHTDIALRPMYSIRREFWQQTVEQNVLFYVLSIVGSILCLTGNRRKDLVDERHFILGLYGVLLWAFGLWHKQPWPYFFVILIPTFAVLNAAAFAQVWARFPRRSTVIILGGLVVCTLASSALRISRLLQFDTGYQRHMVDIADRLVGPDELYLAGVDMLYDRQHPTNKLRRISRAKQ